MKANILKKAVQATGFLVSLVALSGCVEHEQALCTEDNAIEIVGLAGEKAFRISTGRGEVSEETMTISYLGDGKYLSGEAESRACKLGKHMALETLSKTGGYSVAFVESLGDGSFLISVPVLSKEDLEAAGIPYDLVKAPTVETPGVSNLMNLMDVSEDETQIDFEFLRAKNTTAEQSEALRNLYRPGSLGYTLRQVQ